MDEAGFDAVIGNPPYVRISSLSDAEKEFLSSEFPEIYAGNSDLLYYFMAKSAEELRQGGRSGLIVARYFAEAKFAEGLRKYLSENTKIHQIGACLDASNIA